MSDRPRILLVEDDPQFARRLQLNLEAQGFVVARAESGEAALRELARQYFDLVVTDIKMSGLSGGELIQRVKSGEQEGVDSSVPFVALTSVNDVNTAVETMRAGAADFITKESETGEVVMRLRKALEQSRLLNENRLLRDQLERATEFRELIGVSKSIARLKQELPDIAQSDGIVLIEGETGVGKELVARAIHRGSRRAAGPFVDVNCAALPDDNLFHSAVFGHERGAFTGATSLRKGRFELAAGGTLFLDEISELAPASQSALLKAIETRRITRLGGSREFEVDCRVLCAANRPLKALVESGAFRRDLYYRINVLPLHIPPLRERREDVEPLARFYLEFFCEKYRRTIGRVTPGALRMMMNYDWPGNIRELRNILERLTIRNRSGELDEEQLAACGIGAGAALSELSLQLPDAGFALEEFEKKLIVAALEKADWNQKNAAALLDISLDRMNSRVRKFGLKHPSWKVHK